MSTGRPNRKPASKRTVVTQEALVADRGVNLRQLLLRSTRLIGARIETELRNRGYDDIRLSHSVVIANLDLGGNSITEIAERAQTTKQSLGLLVVELEEMGYLVRRVDPNDARARIIRFTARGRRLLLASLEIIDEIEREAEAKLGPDVVAGLRQGLIAFAKPSLPDGTL